MTREISPIKTVGNQIRNFGPSAIPADAPDLEIELDEESEAEEVQESPDPKEETSNGSATEPAPLDQNPSTQESVPTESETTVPEPVVEETKEENGSHLSLLDPNLG